MQKHDFAISLIYKLTPRQNFSTTKYGKLEITGATRTVQKVFPISLAIYTHYRRVLSGIVIVPGVACMKHNQQLGTVNLYLKLNSSAFDVYSELS